MTSDVSEVTRLRRLAWTMRKEWITALQVERQLERISSGRVLWNANLHGPASSRVSMARGAEWTTSRPVQIWLILRLLGGMPC